MFYGGYIFEQLHSNEKPEPQESKPGKECSSMEKVCVINWTILF